MEKHYLSTLKISALVVCVAGVLVGCGIQTAHEKEVAMKATAEGLTPTDSHFDGTFVAQDVHFSQYKKIQLEPLDLDNVEILRSKSGPSYTNTPWVLNDNDKAQYRSRYLESVTRHLLGDGRFSTTLETAPDTLILRSRIVQIAPLASKDDAQGRPGIMKSYSEGMGTMTIEMTLYDATSGKVLAIITDRRELGSLWEENNRMTNAIHIRNAFNMWLKKLREELTRLS